MSILEIISGLLILAGSFFCLVGGIGIIRLPDFYTRTHGASVTDTMGAGLLLVGMMMQPLANGSIIVKLGIILGFLLITSPTSGHALVKAAFARGVKVDLELEDHVDG